MTLLETQLVEALSWVSSGSIDGQECWCDAVRNFPLSKEHSPACNKAKQALAAYEHQLSHEQPKEQY